MLHYTLSTNHTRVSPRGEVSDDAIAMLAPYLTPGRHRLSPPLDDYEVTTTIDNRSMLATVSAPGDRPCVTFAIAADDDSAGLVWASIESLYLQITDSKGFRAANFESPHQPPTTPWCAAVPILATADEAFWMADFERCLAWAFIEN